MRERLIWPLLGAACIAALLGVTYLELPSASIGAFVLLFAVLFHGYLLGTATASKTHWTVATAFGIVLFLAVQSVIQTAWYYAADALGPASDAVSVIVPILLAQILAAFKPDDERTTEPQPAADGRTTRIVTLIAGSVLALTAAILAFLVLRGAASASTVESIRTPWPLLPSLTLAAIAATWLLLVVSALAIRSPILTALNAAFAIVSTTAIAPLVYRIGYGFDGFLHVASERILLATGTLTPKPLYYIGQYVFTTWLARATSLPVADIDRWLVPAAAAILLPLCLLIAVGPSKRASGGFIALGLLPLGGFIATTPQGFAYVLGLAALLLCVGLEERNVSPVAPLILAAWVAASHPLAGIPLLLVVLACVLARSDRKALRIGGFMTVIAAAASVPVMFYVMSEMRGLPIAWNFGILTDAATWTGSLGRFVPWIGNHYALWPGWATLASASLPLLLLAASVGGYVATRNRVTLALTISAVGLWLSGIALSTAGDFAFLIDYERGNYADRLDVLASYCLVAAVVAVMPWFWDRARNAPRLALAASAGFLIAFAVGLAYDSLPRHDALVTGRGWSVSRYDVEAVKLIDRDADGRDYAVLANQSVSAAAVANLGFKRYAGDVFFYPIPTGGPLYETYLRMTYQEPSRDTIMDAARLAKTDLVYLVLNDYWWRSLPVSEQIRGIAEKDWDVGGDPWKIRVYRFDVSTDSRSSTTSATQ